MACPWRVASDRYNARAITAERRKAAIPTSKQPNTNVLARLLKAGKPVSVKKSTGRG